MIAVIDYGLGNLFSLLSSLRFLGAEAQVTADPAVMEEADKLILPGVGAFGDAAAKLRELGLDTLLKELAAAGKPLMGICLGMQLLFEESHEYGCHQGLGLIPGKVMSLAPVLPDGMKVPHMGWNSLTFHKPEDVLLSGINEGSHVYYVHSFYATDCEAAWVATSEYGGVTVPGAVRCGNVCGTQFHPEKSGGIGLQMLASFAKEDTVC